MRIDSFSIKANRGMINQILGRVHVGESDLSACRHVIKSMSPSGRESWRAFDRWSKRALIRGIIYIHGQHRLTYGLVMGGHLGADEWVYKLMNATLIK